MTAAYVITTLNITDPEIYESKYVANVYDIFAKYGAEVLVVDEEPDVREGNWPYKRTIVEKFPSIEKAREWYESPEYQEFVKHRWASSEGNLIIVKEFNPDDYDFKPAK